MEQAINPGWFYCYKPRFIRYKTCLITPYSKTFISLKLSLIKFSENSKTKALAVLSCVYILTGFGPLL